jgi:SagB-type dehydrogenase family enzyme
MTTEVELPKAAIEGEMSVEEAIAGRRSRREFTDEALTLAQVAQLLWCAQGTTDERSSKRAAPSAGATYPLEVFIAVGKGGVEELKQGVYRYVPSAHALVQTGGADVRARVAAAALNQTFVAEAPVVVLIAADYRRTTQRYGERGIRYVHMEVGHAGQNVYLQAEALGLGTVSVGAFDDRAIAGVLGLPGDLRPLYLMPVGHVR